MNCKCCHQRLTPHRQGMLAQYCDVVCYAAVMTLTPHALEMWRRELWRLSVSMPAGLARWRESL